MLKFISNRGVLLRRTCGSEKELKMNSEQRTERARKAARALHANSTPEQRSASARKAAAARHSLDTYIKAIVSRAPELTDEQVEKLRPILTGGR